MDDIADDRLQGQDFGFCLFDPHELEEAKNAVCSGKVDIFIEGKLNGWKDAPLNVGITGNSGTGKSTFINTVRGLTDDDPGAAPTGVVECTTVPTPYEHPRNPNVKFWDLPGVGTPNFPRLPTETHLGYLDSVGFDRFDFFLVFATQRFREEDLWLASEVTARGKRFYFIRTKIDCDIESRKRSNPRQYRQNPDGVATEVMQLVQNDIRANFEEAGMSNVPVFLIDSFEDSKYQFPALEGRLLLDLPKIKREAMIYTLTSVTKDRVEEKVNVLKDRIWKVATASAAAGAIPIPLLGAAFDVVLILNEMKFYSEQLGLDNESLDRLAKKTGMDVGIFKDITRTLPVGELTKEAIKSAMTSLAPTAVEMVAEEASKFIPFIGFLISGGLSFGATYWFLDYNLNKMKSVALDIIDVATTHEAEVDRMVE